MKVSSAANSPSMKAEIHFAKPGVLFNKNASYTKPEGQKISSEGIRYFEDTKVPAEIKDRVQSIPLVKKLSEAHDVFVNYISICYKQPNMTVTRLRVLYADYSKKLATEYFAEGIEKEAQTSIDVAFGKFCDLRANRALTGELSFFEKMIGKVKKLSF
ncbi:MAG: hypothetical protein NC408_02735 [Candidatus Gastranaerophilales bacterium]|nr:hypothetical protein [Candidatus Gastranaerophilales bacterium]MCM1072755.1 hypothetical protein [Bacteroides sp.]